MKELYEPLSTNADLCIASIEHALWQMGNPEGSCVAHVSPQWVALDRAWLDALVEDWAQTPRKNTLQVVGDHDIRHLHEWYVECRGRRVGSPAP